MLFTIQSKMPMPPAHLIGVIDTLSIGECVAYNCCHPTVAPEVIKLEKPSCASDIWSLACTVVELITGKPPYSNLLAMTAMFKIVEDDMPPLPSGCSPELADFLKLCFRKTPHKRPTAQELFQHRWLSKHWMAHKVCTKR
jgi:serine/threonine protein kinase